VSSNPARFLTFTEFRQELIYLVMLVFPLSQASQQEQLRGFFIMSGSERVVRALHCNWAEAAAPQQATSSPIAINGGIHDVRNTPSFR